jgi:hypothetical protein
MTNKGYRAYVLYLYACSEINHNLEFEDPSYLGDEPGNPAMAILPMFELRDDTPTRIDVLTSDKEFILGLPRKHGIPAPSIASTDMWHDLFTNREYADGAVAIARFDATEWPAATSTVVDMLREVLSRMVLCLDTRS